MRLTLTILGWTVSFTTEPTTSEDDDDTVAAIAGPPSADLTPAPHQEPATYEPDDHIGFQ